MKSVISKNTIHKPCQKYNVLIFRLKGKAVFAEVSNF